MFGRQASDDDLGEPRTNRTRAAMTYFPDLSPYRYVPERDDDGSDLNVGWLSADHPYPTSRPDRRLISALLRCSLRPVRPCRGFHVCELRCKQALSRRPLICRHQGRTVELGNGEVRVTGADRKRYAAPTLVAHYVAVHGYVPPKPFVDGVMRQAREIRVLRGESLTSIRGMSVADRFALCLDALGTYQSQHPDNWLAEAIAALGALKAALDPRRFATYGAALERLDTLLEAGGEDPLSVAVRNLRGFFAWVEQHQEYANQATVGYSVTVIERSHEAGLMNWRKAMTPSRWGEAS